MKIINRGFALAQRKFQYIKGASQVRENSMEVQLRGLKIVGNKPDLPNLIFFPDLFDTVENWLSFFTDSKHPILNQRNVYLLYPRHFGASDSCKERIPQSSLGQHLAYDLERFMYEQKIGSATLGGHGLGAKTALALACHRPELTTGFFAFNYAPLNYRYHQFAQEQNQILENLAALDLKNLSRKQINHFIKEKVQSPKLQKLLNDQLKRASQGFRFAFDLPHVSATFNHLANWDPKMGLFPGRASFIFTEFSDRVHLGSNTIPMRNVCPKLAGYGRDIIRVQTEEEHPDANHWVYEDTNTRNSFLRHLERFLVQYDGVNLMYRNVEDLKNQVRVRSIVKEREDGEHFYIPEHKKHDWRVNHEVKQFSQ